MSNITVVNLDKKRGFRLSVIAIKNFQKYTKVSMKDLGKAMEEGTENLTQMEVMIALVYFGLKTTDPSLTLEELEQIIDDKCGQVALEEDILEIEAFTKVIEPILDSINKDKSINLASNLPSK